MANFDPLKSTKHWLNLLTVLTWLLLSVHIDWGILS